MIGALHVAMRHLVVSMWGDYEDLRDQQGAQIRQPVGPLCWDCLRVAICFPLMSVQET